MESVGNKNSRVCCCRKLQTNQVKGGGEDGYKVMDGNKRVTRAMQSSVKAIEVVLVVREKKSEGRKSRVSGR